MIIDIKTLKNSEIASGGEANIYDDGAYVLKIFQPHIPKDRKKAKVQALCKVNFPDNIVAPTEELTDRQNNFIGYRMKKISHAEPVHQLTKNRTCQLRNLTNLDLLKLILKVSEMLERIHANKMIIGDLNAHNLMISERDVEDFYFIDTDSWGVGGLEPDAYTELFIPAECYQGNKIKLSRESDIFSLAVLSWQLLTKIHPFGGTYKIDPNLATVDRIKRNLSLISRSDKYIIPKIIGSWDWMSLDLHNKFQRCFEKGDRGYFTDELREQIRLSQYCHVHNIYYYGAGYLKCPLCHGAQNVAQVVVTRTTTSKFQVIEINMKSDVKVFLGFDKFLRPDGNVEHIASGKTVQASTDYKINFSDNGDKVYRVYEDFIEEDGIEHSRKFRSPYQIKDRSVYYIDVDNYLVHLACTNFGNIKKKIVPARNAKFRASTLNKVFILQHYAKPTSSMVVLYDILTGDTRNFEIGQVGKFDEYFIQQDIYSDHNWTFIYKTETGRHRTLIIGDKGIVYDADTVNYEVSSLSNLWYMKDTIYDCGDGKIIAKNLKKNIVQEFPCDVVDNDSKLKFADGVFNILNKDKMWQLKPV